MHDSQLNISKDAQDTFTGGLANTPNSVTIAIAKVMHNTAVLTVIAMSPRIRRHGAVAGEVLPLLDAHTHVGAGVLLAGGARPCKWGRRSGEEVSSGNFHVHNWNAIQWHTCRFYIQPEKKEQAVSPQDTWATVQHNEQSYWGMRLMT